jgi:pimeloyl-ACP methyl ester carboxylesterase
MRLRLVKASPAPTPPPVPAPAVQFRTIHGYRRAFVQVGRGPAILLIHGICDSSATWQGILPALAEDHMVIAPDLLGHGASDKPRADYSVAAYANAMRDLLSVLDVDRVTVVGHSFGGGVAMQFAYQFPERCERLVLVSTGGISREVHPVLRLVSAPTADFFLPLLRAAPVRVAVQVALSVAKAAGTDVGRDADNFGRVFEVLPDAASTRSFVRTLRAVVDWRGQVVTMLDRCYLAAEIPTMLVWGAHDPVIPPRHAQLAHAAMPGSRLEVLSSAGHFPHHADPEAFLSLVRDFVRTTAPAAHSPEEWRALLRRGRPQLPVPTEPRVGGRRATAREAAASGT